MKKLFLMILAGSVMMASCKKDDTTTPTPKALEKSPVATAFLINTNTTVIASGSGNYEYGMKFQVTQNGKVTKLGARMPTAGTYRVTLWDASVTPKVAITSANVTVTAGGLAFTAITPAALTTGKDYLISIWSSAQWFEIRPVGGGSFSYPITQGSIQFTGYQWVGTAQTPQTFPTNTDVTYIAGIMDMEYQPD